MTLRQITVAGELYSKKNSKDIFVNKKTGKYFIASNQKAREAEQDLVRQLEQLKELWHEYTDDLPRPLKICFKIYRKSERKFDYNNITQGLLDAMVKAGLLIDDNMKCVIPYYEPYSVDRKNPRTIISLL